MANLQSILLFLSIFVSLSLRAQVSNNQDSLLKALEILPNSPEKVRALVHIGSNYTKFSMDKALDYFQQAITLGEQIKESVYSTTAYSQMAILYNNLGKPEEANYYLEETKKRAEKSGDNKILGNYYQSATLIYKKRKDYSQALTFAKLCLESDLKIGQRGESLAGAQLNLANCYKELKQYRQAITHFYESLKIFEELDNVRGKAYCYNNLADVYLNLGRYNEAIQNAKESITLKKKLKDEKGLANSYIMVSQAYFSSHEPLKALLYLKESIAINKKMQLIYALVENYNLKARIQLDLKDTSSAIHSFKEALYLANDLKSSKLVNDLKLEFEQLNNSKQKSEENITKVQMALRKAVQNTDTTEILNNLNFLYKYYYQHEDYKKAFDYREEYQTIRDIVYTPTLVDQLRQTQSNYEIEKRENAIHLLEKDQQIKKSQILKQRMGLYTASGMALLIIIFAILLANRNKVLNENKRKKALETVRNNIAGDLHDDIGSNLSSIQIISEMAQNYSQDNPRVNESLGRISELSAKVSEGIREIVWSANPAHDTMEAFIGQLRKLAADRMGACNMAFTFRDFIDHPEIVLTPQKRKDFFMIYKEGLNNACKYSQSARVDISIRQTDNVLSLQIKDNGCGFDMESVKRGNGLDNMERRAASTQSKLTILNQQGEGTTLQLKMPYHELGR